MALRDQEDQKPYYDLFGFQTGVLVDKKTDIQGNIEKDGDFSTEVLNFPIVYSTNCNFQFIILRSLFVPPENQLINDRIRAHDIVIVDEVDNMFLDQANSPAIIASTIKLCHTTTILKTIFEKRNLDTTTIINLLKNHPDLKGSYNDFPIDEIDTLKLRARRAVQLECDDDYIVIGGKVIIIDKTTGYPKWGSRWNGCLHQMVEIKEGTE